MNSSLPHVLLNTEGSGHILSRRDRKGASVNENFERALTAACFHALVRAIGTVFVSVTLPTLRDAHVGSGTLERLRAAGFGLCNRNSSWIFGTSQGIPGSATGVCACSERCFSPPALTALAVLVAAVATVIRSVTHPALGDAAVVGAFKLGAGAELVCKRTKGSN